MALDFDLYIDQGSDFTVNLTVTAADGTTMDLTGYSAISQLRRSFYSLNSVTILADISDPTNGVITLSLPASSTTTLWATRYVYDVNVISPSNITSRVFEGMITVTPGVSSIPEPQTYEFPIPYVAKIAGSSSCMIAGQVF